MKDRLRIEQELKSVNLNEKAERNNELIQGHRESQATFSEILVKSALLTQSPATGL